MTYGERKEKRKAYDSIYRTSHIEEKRILAAAYRANNLEKEKLRHRIYYLANKGKAKIRDTAWRTANPEAVRRYTHNRRARKIANGGKLSSGICSKLFILQRGKCAICKKGIKRSGFHLDHIIPLSRGGKNSDGNSQLTCPTCNLKKGGKDPIQFMQSLGYLL